jgi:hypothetical protein
MCGTGPDAGSLFRSGEPARPIGFGWMRSGDHSPFHSPLSLKNFTAPG